MGSDWPDSTREALTALGDLVWEDESGLLLILQNQLLKTLWEFRYFWWRKDYYYSFSLWAGAKTVFHLSAIKSWATDLSFED